MFTWVDLVLLIAVFGFVFAGFFFGLVGSIGALVGLFGGIWVAGQYYMPVAKWLMPIVLNNQATANIIAFILLFALVNRLVGLLFYILNKVFKIITIVPFIGSINKLAGAILGFFEGILAVGLIVYIIAKFASGIPWVAGALDHSKIAHALVFITSFLTYLLPTAIDKMKSVL